jgi:tetratricopeptide (TPR) repeat protein
MTTHLKKEIVCAVCKKPSTQSIMTSTSQFGSPDLDTRPPDPDRYSNDLYIQTCPSCGYCNRDISSEISNASEIIARNDYERQLNNQSFSHLSNAFLCSAIIMENNGNYAIAAFQCLRAAWDCDDNHSNDSAVICRERAIELLQMAIQNGQEFFEGIGGQESLIVDLLRRTRRFKEAMKYCEMGLRKNPEKLISNILWFQKLLIGNSDDSCHLIKEAAEMY